MLTIEARLRPPETACGRSSRYGLILEIHVNRKIVEINVPPIYIIFKTLKERVQIIVLVLCGMGQVTILIYDDKCQDCVYISTINKLLS